MSFKTDDECYTKGVKDGYAAAIEEHNIVEDYEDDEDDEQAKRIRLEEEERIKRIEDKAAAKEAQREKVAAIKKQTDNYKNSEAIKAAGKGLRMPGAQWSGGGRSKRNPNTTKKRKAKITKKRTKTKSTKKRK